MAHVDRFSRQTQHLEDKSNINEAATISGPLKVHFEDEQDTSQAIRVAEGPDNEAWLRQRNKIIDSMYITCLDKNQLIVTPWWEIPIKVQEEDRPYSLQSVINVYETAPKFVLVILCDDEGVYMSQRINPNKPMFLKYQVVCGKVEAKESGTQAAQRETLEETGLNIELNRIRYVINDPEFDCDVFYIKLQSHEIPERTEPHNMGSWLYYSWITWYQMAVRKQTTSTLTTFRDTIDNVVRQ